MHHAADQLLYYFFPKQENVQEMCCYVYVRVQHWKFLSFWLGTEITC